jgi:hypothetical protein
VRQISERDRLITGSPSVPSVGHASVLVLVPRRREALQLLAWTSVIAVWGFAESFAGAFARFFFLICIPYGYWLLRRSKRVVVDYDNLPEPPPGSFVESWRRTALRTLVIGSPSLSFVVIGLFVPVVGAGAGGFAVGLLLGYSRTVRNIARMEARDGRRLLIAVPRRLIARPSRQPTYFRA